MKIDYKPFKMKHYERVYEFWQNIKVLGMSEADNKENIKRYLKKNRNSSFVALNGSEVIGTILAGHDGRRGYIHHVAIDENHRKKGIAKNLINLAIAKLKKEGMVKCHIFVFKENKNAKNFWSHTGWTERTDLDVMSYNII
ncbi:MAG: GNAT family N-acetyltransferase [Spirochaetes bacterium]|nr:GNAT family N-acetyltransferase [Spirochaetota bacterium]